jgi:hypothetical protein
MERMNLFAKCSLLTFFFALKVFNVTAQNELYFGFNFPDTIPSAYLFDVKKEYLEASDFNRKGVSRRDIERYAEAVSYGKQELFASGFVYIGWDSLESYLNDVLRLVLPDELKPNQNIHIYPTRDPDYNAFCIHDGSLFLNIGLLADVENEAALAIIIGHEISHFLNDDVKEGYFKSMKLYTRRNRNANYTLKLSKARFDRSIESRADSLGFILAENAGYDISYGISNYLTFKNLEQYERSKKKQMKLVNASKQDTAVKSDSAEVKAIEDLLASHPDLTTRIEFLNEFMHSPDRKNGKQIFLVDQTAFKLLQQKAKLESISILLNSNDYKECVKRSFIYYLLDPDNDNYVYYLLESLRRLMYTDPRIATKEFLSDENRRNPKGEGILHSLRLLIPDNQKYNRIKDTTILDTLNIAFETYEEAFKYFENIALKRKISETFLTLGLHYHSIDSIRRNYLTEYLSYGKVRYRKFAESLLKDSLMQSLENNKRELVLFDKISFVEDHFYGYHDRVVLAESRSPGYTSRMNMMVEKEFPKINIVEIEKWYGNNFRKKIILSEVIYSTFLFNKDKKKNSSSDVVYFNKGTSNNSDFNDSDIKKNIYRHIEKKNITDFELQTRF